MKTIKLVQHFLNKSRAGNSVYSVVRVSKNGIHTYSVLAHNNGFEFIFRNGHDRWSTVSPSFAARILKRHADEINDKKIDKNANYYINLFSKYLASEDSGWTKSRKINFTDRTDAIRTERLVLDKSWEGIEKNDKKN